MIFVHKHIDPEFMLKLLELGLDLNGRMIVLWKYLNNHQDTSNDLWDEVKTFAMGKKNFEQVTLYNDDQLTKEVDYYKFDRQIIEILAKKYESITDILDSIAIYKENHTEWFLCMIFHEEMSLLKLSEDEVGMLKTSGIPYSYKAPDWW